MCAGNEDSVPVDLIRGQFAWGQISRTVLANHFPNITRWTVAVASWRRYSSPISLANAQIARRMEAIHGAQVTVLLAANDWELVNALAFILNHRGYHVVTALSGDGAVALADLQLPHLAVVDMLLPGQSGFQLTRLLKERWMGGFRS